MNDTDPQPTKAVRPRWMWRTVFLSIPLHVAVFVLLYFGGLYLVRTEMIGAHAEDAEMLLAAAVDTIHLVMRDGSGDDLERVRTRLQMFAASHRALHMRLWNAAGEPIAGSSESPLLDPLERRAVAGLLGVGDGAAETVPADEKGRHFWVDHQDDGVYLRGMMEIRTDGRCLPCHAVGETRGAATVSRNLSPQLAAVSRRLLVWIGIGVGVWVTLASLVNRTVARAYRQQAARVRAGLHAAASGTPAKPTLMLDPMSMALFESLSRSLEEQHQREESFASQLHHADRLASLGQLAAGLAHEIKNPLAGVQGVLEILRDETGHNDSMREIHEQMLAELKRVDGIIRALLRFARPSPPRRRPTDVPALLEDAVQLLRPGLVRRGIELVLETAPGLGKFSLDGEQIRQVVVNLISNASEAMEQEGQKDGRIVVRATAFPQGGGVLIAVEDNGPGISEENRTKVFRPFFTTKYTGTGLGLAVVDSLVTQHGGRLELTSSPGEGATFFVVLPPVPGDEDRDEAS